MKFSFTSLALCIEWVPSERRSLHTESEILVRNFHSLKNKYNHTLCQTRLPLKPLKLSSVVKKKIGSVSILCIFASIASILIGKDDKYKKKCIYENVGLSVQCP